eukprot:8106201-Alexandrium_andersonii.AAC.1
MPCCACFLPALPAAAMAWVAVPRAGGRVPCLAAVRPLPPRLVFIGRFGLFCPCRFIVFTGPSGP